jgi:hypothetical protein
VIERRERNALRRQKAKQKKRNACKREKSELECESEMRVNVVRERESETTSIMTDRERGKEVLVNFGPIAW